MSNKLFASFCGSCSTALIGADFNKNAAPVASASANNPEGFKPAGQTYEL